MIDIGGVKLNSKAVLAPLAGFTDAGFRDLCVSFGAGLTITEMVSAKGLVYGGRGSEELLFTTPSENPVAVQIFGSEPEFIFKAAKHDLLKKFDIIDINMGCPVPKIVKNGEGSALLKNNGLIEEIVAAAVEGGGRPVTVKIRLGFDDGEFSGVENALAAERGGASAVAVHARTRSQFYSGKADWEKLALIKSAVKIPVIANGDVVDKQSFDKILEVSGCDAVMIGRAALGAPYVFSEVVSLPFSFEPKAAITRHIEVLRQNLPDKIVANLMKKHIFYYAKNLTNRKQVRLEATAATELNQLFEVVEKYF